MKSVLISVLLALSVITAWADGKTMDKQPSPEEMKQLMEASIGAMVPAMGQMTSAIMEAQLIIAEKPETAQRIATFKKNLYDTLMKKGFSDKQAFEIMLYTSLPVATPGMK